MPIRLKIMTIRTLTIHWVIYPVLTILIYSLFQNLTAAETINGFDLSDTLIPNEEIFHGGPPRDGIPAIDKPDFITVKEVNFLEENDRILGVERNGIRKAYPVRILDYHEIVNDQFGSEAIVISYCPLCATGMAFDATINDEKLSFGVSGLLYNSDVLLYDRNTGSLWSQIMSQAISGSLKGEKLDQIPLTHTTWADWSKQFPDSLILSTDTGFQRDYTRSPYSDYANSNDLYFKVKNFDRRYHPKEFVIGISIGDQHKTYPFIELSKTKNKLIDKFADQELRIEYDVVNRTGKILDADGQELPTTIAYWFAWMAFHPDAEVYKKD